ncbi:hypothetical protein ASF53_22190 [Methylobacterium sp. Leaf123]|uniref:curli-like amyloid fiber formation chaperone CsgH n=1 Tax=Methylobacterium sp. Leaf123 TaxID=1736264 RepID=UPI0006F4C7C1|nr:curli-like amyloid fiber formation chaperone CsgH [Methylobacterium sp. Leaf123]KQQ25391.1 hypothetical protein ASF53_22190 [Methylobacterium sp. Leaf123]
MTGDLPPLPITCSVTELRQGSQIQIDAEIRSDAAQSGHYRLLVLKQGSSGSAQVSQQSDFSVAQGAAVRIQGLRLSIEPHGRYRARLLVRVGNAEYTCEREGPDAPEPL